MADAIERLSRKLDETVRLTRVFIPRHKSVSATGKVEDVEAHWREIKSINDLTPDERKAVVGVPGEVGPAPGATGKAVAYGDRTGAGDAAIVAAITLETQRWAKTTKTMQAKIDATSDPATKARLHADLARKQRDHFRRVRALEKRKAPKPSPANYEERAAASTPKKIASYEGVHPYGGRRPKS